ncbi:hypothetical protein [Methylogaea oryzae]|uniref:hypothetical protein n=1 Tax=Methylogaea oryzae TaxID=1295382 RepID=UPI0012E207BD|nr:hypothetical protein [Methylogaea oryzae]
MKRDSCQQRIYAVRRVGLAIDRAARATSKIDKRQAARWATAWGVACGVRQF